MDETSCRCVHTMRERCFDCKLSKEDGCECDEYSGIDPEEAD